MGYGIFIKSGLSDWQIIQQEKKVGTIHLKGTFFKQNEEGLSDVYIRVVREDNGESVIFWRKAFSDPVEKCWDITINDIPVGGLYRIETCLKEDKAEYIEWSTRGDQVHHFCVGDLFVIAGQSNAAGYGKDVIYDPPEMGIHLLRNCGKWDIASHPLNDSTGAEESINYEPVNCGSSPYLSFAKEIKKQTGIPVGLIQTALGGSPLARWNPAQEGDLYSNMLKKIENAGGRVKGVLWYQGCADTNQTSDAESYKERFLQMVKCLRDDLKDPDLPVFTFQLNRYITPPVSSYEDRNWSVIREAQREAASEGHSIYVLPTIDGNLSDMIHNSSSFNLVLGKRLANQVLSKLYDRKTFSDAPDLKAVELKARKLLLHFYPVYDRLYAGEASISEYPFTVEDDLGIIPILNCSFLNRSDVLIELNRDVAGNVSVHAYFGQNPKCRCLYDFSTHYPILAFSKKVQ